MMVFFRCFITRWSFEWKIHGFFLAPSGGKSKVAGKSTINGVLMGRPSIIGGFSIATARVILSWSNFVGVVPTRFDSICKRVFFDFSATNVWLFVAQETIIFNYSYSFLCACLKIGTPISSRKCPSLKVIQKII